RTAQTLTERTTERVELHSQTTLRWTSARNEARYGVETPTHRLGHLALQRHLAWLSQVGRPAQGTSRSVAGDETSGRRTPSRRPRQPARPHATHAATPGSYGRYARIPITASRECVPARRYRHALSMASWRIPLGGLSSLWQLANAVRAPACCSASLSSYSILTAPSKPTRFNSMKISSRLLASRAVPAVTKFQPLVQWPIGR